MHEIDFVTVVKNLTDRHTFVLFLIATCLVLKIWKILQENYA